MNHRQCLVHGMATGELLFSDVPLSFWAGVEPQTGQIVDRHHPLYGCNINGRILAIPSSRGSCTGSMVLVEMFLNGNAPAGLIFRDKEQIITLGAIVAKALFDLSIPVLVVGDAFDALRNQKFAAISGENFQASNQSLPMSLPSPPRSPSDIQLTAEEKDILNGSQGPAAQKAMEILLSFADMQGAHRLLAVTRAHIDACIYTGPASVRIPQKFLSMGARVAIPTTLNAISIDRRRWKEIGMDDSLATNAGQLVDAYMAMGAQSSFTCAPYTLEDPPKYGQDIGWSESNAVVFANSVLGARTQKYPDLIDVCIALTGRAPLSGAHLDEGRVPTVRVTMKLNQIDDSVYPILGYLIGKIVGGDIPLVCGLEQRNPRMADLKALGAALATTASAPMFHVRGVTPEGNQYDELDTAREICLDSADLVDCWQELNTATDTSVGLVSLGNPHFALEEFDHLSGLCKTRTKSPGVKIAITTNREVYQQAYKAGFIDILEAFGAEIITDTCWCMLQEPVIPLDCRNIMTNSAKYAHYAPGMVRRGVHFGSLAQCVEAACTGTFSNGPSWELL
ncbi:hypothetical protein ASPWEDRAFT_35621 [Aspergillus wentii DTO 134E9]|uniref:Aconitase X catalytic domain-containing protein n=1 Tax=Aspergillus wentii DTO 134E9 TaxID=1073089 RepID=A0A1L9RTB2_ASPWE|nr:uncharacterized protein ASPWEDRAFT_35621 [Aspergillus wentii DTO 134E9]KAI9933709.1 hypothetical protein MW887_004780 [Aspergillus wentii]OJJ38047.1 hypothetical protein ASPWEDRAFT_35621 [Aspergillus wentii DTO 134E9]